MNIDIWSFVGGLILLVVLALGLAVCLLLLLNYYCEKKFGISLASLNAESIKRNLALFNELPATIREANRRAKEALEKIQATLDNVDAFQIHLDNVYADIGKMISPIMPQIKNISESVAALNGKAEDLHVKQHERLGRMRQAVVDLQQNIVDLRLEVVALASRSPQEPSVEEGDLKLLYPESDKPAPPEDILAQTLTYASPVPRQTAPIPENAPTAHVEVAQTGQLAPEELSNPENCPTVKVKLVKPEFQLVADNNLSETELQEQAFMKTEVSLPPLKSQEQISDDPMKTVVGLRLPTGFAGKK